MRGVWWTLLVAGVLGLMGCAGRSIASVEPTSLPSPPAEFRALWVATVANIDWPSARGIPPALARREMNAILDTAAGTGYNAIVLQVRPAADVIYPSDIEPWTEFLTGACGKPPPGDYDPLEEWIAGAHARGLELHAWFNPFRARHKDARAPNSRTHVLNRRPDIVHEYGEYWWMDPGHPVAREQTLAVMREVLSRYDIDGVHIDDYFYPYPERNLPFPDDATYSTYQRNGGTLPREEWRRQNINALVRDMYAMVKREKPWVKVGISPFGIYRPGFPQGVVGFDQYAQLYADARLWWREGWMDYNAPQLYWDIRSSGQPFQPLLEWWASENRMKRHLWPGQSISRVTPVREPDKRTAAEIVEQIGIIRAEPGADGWIQFSVKALMEDRQGLRGAMTRVHAGRALIPESTWLTAPESRIPGEGAVRVRDTSETRALVTWWTRGDARVRQWALWLRYGNRWTVQVLPPDDRAMPVDRRTADGELNAAAIRAFGVAGKGGPIGHWSRGAPTN